MTPIIIVNSILNLFIIFGTDVLKYDNRIH